MPGFEQLSKMTISHEVRAAVAGLTPPILLGEVNNFCSNRPVILGSFDCYSYAAASKMLPLTYVEALLWCSSFSQLKLFNSKLYLS